MNGYIAFHKGRKIQVQAETSYAAQKLAAQKLGVLPKRAYEVTVVLCEMDGAVTTHSTASI